MFCSYPIVCAIHDEYLGFGRIGDRCRFHNPLAERVPIHGHRTRAVEADSELRREVAEDDDLLPL
jgi:hypothetical protein